MSEIVVDYSTRVFYMENERLRRFPTALYWRLIRGNRDYAAPQFAGQTVRFAVVHVKERHHKPLSAYPSSFDLITFDENGKIAKELLLSQLAAKVDAYLLKRKGNPIPTRTSILAESCVWEPSAQIRAEVERLSMQGSDVPKVAAYRFPDQPNILAIA